MRRWGPELRWRDWLCQLFCCDKREIGRLGCPCRKVCIWGMRKFALKKKGRGLRSRAEEGKRFEIAGPIRETALWA